MDYIAKKEGEDVKAEGGETIVIRVCDSEGNNVHFRVKSDTKMKKVFKNYSAKMGRDQSYFRFMYDGRCIGQNDTPESLGMEDGDHIDCELEQVLYDFDGSQVDNGLTCYIGNILRVEEDCDDWLWVSYNGKEGFVPATFVEKVKIQTNDSKPQQIKPVSSSICSYDKSSSSSTFKRDPELDKILKRQQKIADIEVNENIDESTLRRGNVGTIHSSHNNDGLCSNELEEEKKKYTFKRDPQLDALLKRKQKMIERKEEPVKQEKEEKKFEFKRDPELDAMLRRKQRVATRVVDEGDAERIRNIQSVNVVIQHKRTQDEIMKEIEASKGNYYYEQKATPRLPESKPVRYSIINEADPVLSVTRNKVTTFTSIDPLTPLSPQKAPNKFFFPSSPQEKRKQEDSPQNVVQEDSPQIDVQEDSPQNVVQEDSPQNVVQEDSPQNIVQEDSPKQVDTANAIRDSLGSVSATSKSSSIEQKSDFEMDSLLEDVTLDDLLTAGMELSEEPIGATKQSFTSVKPSIEKQSSVDQSLDVSTYKSFDMSTSKSMDVANVIKPIPCMVMFDFQSSNEQEISVYAGETVIVKSIVGEWCLIETTTEDEGYVPISYLQEIQNEYKQVRIIYDFVGTGDNQLSVQENDIVTVLSLEGEWMEGETHDGRNGWFPASFAEYILIVCQKNNVIY